MARKESSCETLYIRRDQKNESSEVEIKWHIPGKQGGECDWRRGGGVEGRKRGNGRREKTGSGEREELSLKGKFLLSLGVSLP